MKRFHVFSEVLRTIWPKVCGHPSQLLSSGVSTTHC